MQSDVGVCFILLKDMEGKLADLSLIGAGSKYSLVNVSIYKFDALRLEAYFIGDDAKYV